MEKISVIVPYYNSNVFLLRKCLQSLCDQTYKNIEVLVVIDGSEKEIDKVKDFFQEKDTRIRFAEIEHAGVSAARNYGIKHTDGKFIAFVDSDDFVEEIFLDKLYQGIKNADLSICGVSEQYFPTGDANIDTRIFFSLPAEYNYLQYTNFSVNKLYRREVIEKYDIYFPESIGLGEDAIFLTEYYKNIKHIAVCSSLMYHYVWNHTSATKKYQPKYWEWEKNVIYRQWELFHRYPLTERESNYMYAWLFHKFRGLFLYYCHSGEEGYVEYIKDIVDDELYKKLLHSSHLNEFWTKEMINDIKKWAGWKQITKLYKK